MKKIYSFLVIVILAALIGAVGFGFYNMKEISAQVAVSKPKIGVLNMALAAQKAEVYRYVFAEKAKYEEKYQKEFEAERDALQEKEKALTEQRDALNEESAKLASEQADIAKSVFEEKQKLFQQKVADFQKEIEAFQGQVQELQEKYALKAQKLQKSAEEASNEIMKASEKALTKINDKEKFDVILNQTAVVFYSDGVDITNEFVEGLDEIIQKVDFKDPEKQTL